MNKNTTVEKQCIDCKQILPLSKFRRYKHKSGDSGYRGSCRKCESKAELLRYHQKETQSNIEKKMECITCKQILPLPKFRRYKNRSGSISYRRYCRKCEREQSRERYQLQIAQSNIEKKLQDDDTFRFMDMYRKVKG